MSMLQTFDFESNAVRVSMRDEMPWFVAADVCRVLGIVNSRDALEKLDDDEKADVALTDTSSNGVTQTRRLNVINESGLYTLVLRSRDAVTPGTLPWRFRKWVTGEVLPSIRRTGGYAMEGEPQGEDFRLFGMPIVKVNSFVSAMRAVNAVFGPEAAQECYHTMRTGRDWPNLKRKTVSAVLASPGGDVAGCLRHLMRAATSGGVSLGNRYQLARHDKAAARSLPDYGLSLGAVERVPVVYIALEHAFLARHFAETPWCGDWGSTLRRISGATKVRSKVRFGRESLSAVAVPESEILSILHPDI